VPRRPSDHDRPSAVPFVALALALALVAGGAAAGVSFLGSPAGSTGGRPRPVSEAAWRSCRPPDLGPVVPAPVRLGSWPYRLLVPGTFGVVTSGPGDDLELLQACGAEETALRVVRLSPAGRVLAVSRMFPRAALLASALLAVPGALFLATARLDLSGQVSLPPYELALYRLDPSSLAVRSSAALGRGSGAELVSAAGQVLVGTGGSLLELASSSPLETRLLFSFGRSDLEHLVAGDGSLVLLSTLVPGATGPAATTRLETLRATRSGAKVVAERDLPPGSSVQALAVSGATAVVAGGSGALSRVVALRLPSLAPASGPGSLAASLDAVGLDVTGRTLWVRTVTSLECRAGATGAFLASTQLSGSPAPVVTGVFRNSEGTFALTGAGLGRLTAPSACG